jgi:hypothetical protein
VASKKTSKGARGFLLSIDGLLSLALVSAAFMLFAAFSQNISGAEGSAYGGISSLGHDYLVLKYAAGKNVTSDDFRGLVGMNASETPAQGSIVLHASAVVYPGMCGCTTTACSINKTSGLGGGASTCLTNQTPLEPSKKDVWITT